MSFVHLHVHSEYSLLDGLSRIPQLVKRAKELGMPGIGLTDHGALFGAVKFYNEAMKAGIKPVIGMETYLSPRGMHDRDPKFDKNTFHLLLLAENDTGYRNLLKIATASQLDGFYYRPRIDHDFLEAHNEGLITTTGCLSGEVPRAVGKRQKKKARKLLDWYMDVFGPDRFFFELQEHDVPELPKINQGLMDLAKRYNGRFIATNDVHYVNPEDHILQDILLCIQTGSVRSDPDRMRMTDDSYYLRSIEEMESIFGHVPGALENTVQIAERCNVDLGFKDYHLPTFNVPQDQTPKSYLRELCESGLRKRYGSRAEVPEIRERLNYELNIIHKMGFDTYFLIVWDLCRHANEEGIWYNARGSAAGSIVAFSLGITLVDPIEHGLIFERFLNPGRVSMPDIDLDFQDDLRYKMLEYTADRYGRDKVAQIITFGTLGARASLRDVGRVLDIPLPEVDRAAKLIPNIPGKPVSIPEALETVTAFNELYQSTPYLREMVDIAAQLEGVARNAGTHAAGVIITPDPIIEYIPLHRPTKSSIEDNPIGAVTQFEMQVLDDLGLLKVDFLGLSTLTVMERACRLIRERHGVKLDIHSIPLDDPDTYQLLGRGAVQGVFQVEGAGMRRNLMEMKPQKLTHVIAMVALYRPGPMKFIPDFIRRMHGEEKVSYRHPKLEPILEETYGITVYQEQIMYTAMNLGGYSASEADDLRKAVAKKKAKQLRKHRDKFVQGAVENGISEDTAKTIFKDWEAFARYGFPKGHAADYAVICVQTAYLKAHYPIEYMTALMSVFKHDTDKVALYIADCRRMGFEVLPPDVNESGNDFEIEERSGASPSIRFGLSAVKNVGEGAADIVIQARQEGGSFTNLQDFARRVDLRHVGKRALESLIQVGAFDCLGPRNALLESMDRIISLSTAYFKAAEVGQMSFFGAETGVADHLELPPPTISIPRRQRLDWERELLGVYVSDHPLTPYLESLTRVVTHFSAELPDTNHQQAVCVAGEICNIRPYQTRNGNPMGFVTLEDLQGTIDLVIFTRVWRKVSGLLEEGKIVIAKGKVDRERGDPKILVDELTTDLSELEVAPGESSRDDSAPFITSPPESETVVIDSLPPAPTLQEDPDDYFQAEQAEISAEDLEDEGAPEEHSEAGDSETLPGKPAQPRAQIHKGGWTPDPQDHPRSRRDETPETFPDSAGSQTGGSPSPKGYGHERALQEPVEPREESPELVELPRLSQGDFYMVKIILHSTGDKKRDALRMRRVHGLLTSYPGNDRFTFQVYEASRRYNLEFPNDTTGYCSELHAQLLKLLGEGSVQTEIQRLQ